MRWRFRVPCLVSAGVASWTCVLKKVPKRSPGGNQWSGRQNNLDLGSGDERRIGAATVVQQTRRGEAKRTQDGQTLLSGVRETQTHGSGGHEEI